tara:strand:+ start:294 stop:482 length:189 start_codon:yes stop_codon:yes gene_type:complete
MTKINIGDFVRPTFTPTVWVCVEKFHGASFWCSTEDGNEFEIKFSEIAEVIPSSEIVTRVTK